MALKTEQLAALLELPEEERVEVANALFDSVDDDEEPAWETAWADELRVRLEGLRSGARKPVPASEVFARVRAKLASDQ